MKKFLLVLSFIFSFAALQKTSAQCTVKDVIVTIVGTPQQNGGGCQVTFNLSFLFNNNGGNKTVVIQAWKIDDYPNYWNCSSTGTSGVNKAPQAADLRKTTAPYSVGTPGPLPFLNIAFDAATQTVIGSASYPGGSVTLGSGYTVSVGAPDVNGFRLVQLNNLTVTVPNQICGDGVTIKADVWSSQASLNSGWTPHCVICGNTYAFGYPKIEGFQNCKLDPNGFLFRQFQYTLTNNNTSQTITYNYQVFRDVNGNDLYEQGTDTLVFSDPTLRTLTPNQSITFGPFSYTGNSGATKDDKVFAVVNVVGFNAVNQLLAQQSCGTLPVKLKNFNASKKVGKVAVTWETEEELNNDGFEIQRRIGNGKYETIAFVDSKAPNGNGSNYTYSYDDAENLPNGVTYYRLRQIDFDGKSIYSDIKAVRSNSKAFVVSVYPNPSRGTTNVAIPEGVGTVDASLEDFTGKLIQRWNSLNTRNLQLTNLKPGIYMLRITVRETGDQVVERILVQ